MVSISIIRNRVLFALICAGRIGSGIGAELGSMRVEQIDAMEVSQALIRSNLSGHAIMATTLMLLLYLSFGDAIALSDRIWLKI
jgi:phospholipid/cholesterol/gamma-HCH transport system permease protein